MLLNSPPDVGKRGIAEKTKKEREEEEEAMLLLLSLPPHFSLSCILLSNNVVTCRRLPHKHRNTKSGRKTFPPPLSEKKRGKRKM